MIKKGYVDTQGGQIHYRYCGNEGAPPLAFFHQTASSSLSYEKLMALLEEHFQMIALDTPGFGQSFFPPEAPTTSYYSSVFFEALSNLGMNSFHAFGHHTGAAIVAEMAAAGTGRVKSVMMDGPVWLSQKERQQWLDAAIDPMVIQEDGSHLMKIWDRVVGLDPDHPKDLCHREALDTLRAGERWHEAYVAVFEQDSYTLYEKMSCPMLLLCGENDVLLPYFEPVCKAYPDATNAILKGRGTYAVDNAAEEIAEKIKSFIHHLG
jgi:pimeloyl-ACP methyl ester carboxylesterase